MFAWGAEKILEVFEALFQWMYAVFVEPFKDLSTVKGLIFGNDDNIWRTFTESELLNVFVPGQFLMMTLAGFILVIGVLMAGIRISGATINPANRTALIEFLKDALIVGIVLSQLGTLYNVIFTVNNGIVGLFESAVSNQDIILYDDGSGAPGQGILGWIVIQLALLGLAIWANFYYLMRKLTLLILMILGPVMVTLYLFPKMKPITSAWLKELTGTVLVQSIHAAVFWIVALISVGTDGIVSTVILYIIFIPVSEAIRNLFGLGGGMQNGLSRAGAMFGLSALAGVGGAIKGALSGKSVGGALQGMYRGAKERFSKNGSLDSDTKNTIGANTGTDTGTTSKAEKMLKAGQILGKAGKMTAGMAGSVAGSVMGPAGAIALGTVGGELGEKTGGLVGRVGAAGVGSIKDRIRKGKEGFNKAVSEGIHKNNDDGMIEALANDESVKWANKNKEKFMEDLKKKFPDARPEELEGRWNDELARRKDEFRNKAKSNWDKVKNSNNQYADANELADAVSSDLSRTWAKENRDAFMSQYDKENPPPKPYEQMTDKEKLEYDNKKAEAWNKKVGEKQAQFAKVGRDVASQMTQGQDHNLVDKQDFAQAMVAKTLDFEKDDMKKSLNLGDDQINQEFELVKGQRKQAFMNIANNAVNSVPTLQSKDNAKAGDIGNALVNGMTNDWAEKNKEAFYSQYGQENPLKENMTPQQMEDYNKKREQAWNSVVSAKKAMYEKAANNTLNDLASGNNNSIVSKDAFANKMIGHAIQEDKDNFVRNNAEKLGGTENAAAIYEEQKNAKQQALTKIAKGSLGNIPSIGTNQIVTEGGVGSTLATQTASDMTDAWSAQHKEQFMKNYEVANPPNPNMSPSELKGYEEKKQNAWKQTVQAKKQQFSEAANSVIMDLSGGNPNAVIDKSQFANSMVNKAMDIERVGMSDISTGAISVDVEYEKTAGERKKAYLSAATQSANSVDGVKVFNGANSVNRNFVASQLASAEMANAKETFINQAVQNGASKEVATQQWDQQKTGLFEEKYQRIMQNIPDKIPASSTFVPLGVKATGAAISHATGINTIIQTAKGIGEGAVAGVSAANQTGQNRITGFFKGGYQGGMSQFVTGATTIEKQQNLRDGLSYATGVIGGVRGYQVGANIANKVSPFSERVQNEIFEPSEVIQMAQTTVDDFGNQVVAKGAVRMVTTNKGSHVEVRTKTGETRIVSRYGSGHSGLREGETVYQDLDVQGNTLVPSKVNGQTSVYRVDSGGGKIPLNTVQLEVDPNRLLANRNNQSVSVQRKQVPTYNQQVDMGKFYLEDAYKQGFSNFEVVVQRNQSYITGKKGNEVYRVSPVYSGDARIPEGKTYQIECNVSNRKLVKGSKVVEYAPTESNEAPTMVDFTTSLDPSKMLANKQNKRLATRRDNEPFRRKQGFLG